MTTATEYQQKRELTLAPVTLTQRVTRLGWVSALSFGAGGFVYGLYFLIVGAVYGFHKFGINLGPWSLANWWNTWPERYNVAQTFSSIHIGGDGGLGTWFVGQWPAIQQIFFQSWPIGIIAGAFSALVLNYGTGKKIGWFDKFTLRLHQVFGVIPSRLQEGDTTPAQYLFMFPLMLFAAAPGALVFFGSDLSLVAFLHHEGYNGFFITKVLGAAWFQIIAGGVFSHQFFANKVTMKPAEDLQGFFEDRALGKAWAAAEAILQFTASPHKGTRELDVAMDAATAAGKKIQVPWWYPPSYIRELNARLDQMLGCILEGLPKPFRERTGLIKAIMIVSAGIFIVVMVIGLYNKFWVSNHGGLYL